MDSAQTGGVEFNLPPSLAGLQTLSEGVERFAAPLQWPSSAMFAVQLCLEEAVSNVIRHGNLADGETVRVAVREVDGQVVIDISDRGIAFDPLEAPAPLPFASLETAVIGGRGIALMRKFCQDMNYRRTDGANHLRLAITLRPQGG